MVMLDRFVAADEERLCAEVVIRPDSLFMGPDGVGSWIGIEYMAQSIAAFAGHKGRLRGEPAKVGFLLGTRRYDVSCALFPPGVVLWIVVKRLMQADNGLGSFECAIYEAPRYADRNHGLTGETRPFDAIDDTLDTAQVLVRATITVFQPHDVTGFLEGKVE
ncbi:3-hydroxylacyl-ACP dehydratase [Glaciimonas sp. PAMC28666]|nr:3-hydroxylacyl-ACP dehydratase [Glaciimonas sp. PAMC28666]